MFLLIGIICFGFSFALLGQGEECEVLSSNSNWLRSLDCSQFNLTTEEIRCLPDATLNLAFHFEADELGRNFTCDSEANVPSASWYAPYLTTQVLDRMNLKMSSALLLNGSNEDAKINFKLNGNGDCGEALFFYDHGQTWYSLTNNTYNLVPGAINIIFRSPNLTTSSIGGRAPKPGSYVLMNDIINDWVSGDNRWWIVANTLLHEIGHTRSLDHAFYCNNVCEDVGFGHVLDWAHL